MKNYEDPKKLAHLRRVQAQRREAAEARIEADREAQRRRNVAAMHKVVGK